MKRFLTAAATLFAALPLLAGEIVTGTVKSSVLGEDVKYNVYLPEGYNKDTHYPVVYLLHGLSDDYTAWATKGGLQIVADELIRSGEVKPMVIVMPNAGGPDVHNTWNGYFNVPGHPYEDFFFGEFLPAVEKEYSCGGCKYQRAIMGLSMGGGGSTVYSQRHPDMFSSCYAMSPWLDNKDDEVQKGAAKDKLQIQCESVAAHSAIDFVANADKKTLEQLRTVAWFIDCGDDDFLLLQTFEFYTKMRLAGVPAQLRVRDGVHNWEYWHLALRMSLPFASRNFK